MKGNGLIERLIYFDKEFVSSQYEIRTGNAPSTQVTRSETWNAGLEIPILKGGAATTESRAYAMSTLGMLIKVFPELREMGDLEGSALEPNGISRTGWVRGKMSVSKAEVKRREGREQQERVIAQQYYHTLQDEGGRKYALMTTPEFFLAGFDAILSMSNTLLGVLNISVDVLLRAYGGKSSFDEWMATPFLILEGDRRLVLG